MAEKLNKEAFIANINECFTLLQTYEECYKEILDIIDALNASDVTIETLQGLIEGSKYISFDVNEQGTKLIINLDRTHIDTAPVYQSENLITSGGVASLYGANIDWSGNHTYDGSDYIYTDTNILFDGTESTFDFTGVNFSITGSFIVDGISTFMQEIAVNDTLSVTGTLRTNEIETTLINSNTTPHTIAFKSGYQAQLPIFDITYKTSTGSHTERYRVMGHNADGVRRLITDADINRDKGLNWNGTQLEIIYNVEPLTQKDYDSRLQSGEINKSTLYVIGDF